MVDLTTGLAGNAIIFTIIYGVLGFLITMYSVYLNWRQAKVNTQMKELLLSVKHIEKIMVKNE